MYCPLACHFCSKSFQNKIKQIQYRSLKLITNDYNSDYKFLPNETGNSAMEIKRLRTHAFEIFKTLNSLNPTFMKDIFNFSPYRTHRKHDIFPHSRDTSNYGGRSLRALGPQTWNFLPENIKSTTSMIIFKDFIKDWLGSKCKCKLCLWIVLLHTE